MKTETMSRAARESARGTRCHFCGGTTVLKGRGRGFAVECNSCGATTRESCPTRAGALEAWARTRVDFADWGEAPDGAFCCSTATPWGVMVHMIDPQGFPETGSTVFLDTGRGLRAAVLVRGSDCCALCPPPGTLDGPCDLMGYAEFSKHLRGVAVASILTAAVVLQYPYLKACPDCGEGFELGASRERGLFLKCPNCGEDWIEFKTAREAARECGCKVGARARRCPR